MNEQYEQFARLVGQALAKRWMSILEQRKKSKKTRPKRGNGKGKSARRRR